jgi:methylase of polypeptide subunit release factors
MEIGADQGDAARLLITEVPNDSLRFERVDILVDYAGRERVLHARMAQ